MPTTNDILAVILSGGVGRRLYPLTRRRAKPAVPVAGKYRLQDGIVVIPKNTVLHIGTYIGPD